MTLSDIFTSATSGTGNENIQAEKKRNPRCINQDRPPGAGGKMRGF
jgi:hypothetical protein